MPGRPSHSDKSETRYQVEMKEGTDRTEAAPQKSPGRQPESQVPGDLHKRLVRSDLELPLWVIAGFVIGVVLEVASASVYIIAIVVLAAIVRLYLEKARTNSRPGLAMVPLFLFGWGLGLLVRAVAA